MFDHDHAFVDYQNIISQTTEDEMTLKEAALWAQQELRLDLSAALNMDCPQFLNDRQWEQVIKRTKELVF